MEFFTPGTFLLFYFVRFVCYDVAVPVVVVDGMEDYAVVIQRSTLGTDS